MKKGLTGITQQKTTVKQAGYIYLPRQRQSPVADVRLPGKGLQQPGNNNSQDTIAGNQTLPAIQASFLVHDQTDEEQPTAQS